MPSPLTVTVPHTFDVPAERVFDAWLDSAWIARWMFGPTVRNERIVAIALDARVGGTFSFAVHRCGTVLDHHGTYLAIERPGRLAFTWSVDDTSASTVTITVAVDAAGAGCLLTLTHEMDPQWADVAERTRDGWAFMLGTLDRELHPTDGCLHRTAPDTVRMERLLPGPIDRVWTFLTDPDQRALWLAGGPMELRVGGAVELQFRHAHLSPHAEAVPERFKHLEHGHALRGTVTRLDPPHLLAFTWGGTSEVTFELVQQGPQVRLVLTHTRLADDQERLGVSGGWHTHVDILDDRLHGRTPGAFWSRHAQLEALYHQREHNG